MGIFDIFTFKKEAKLVFTSGNFVAVLEKAREEIIDQAKNHLPGPEKKLIVDKIVISGIRDLQETCGNKLVVWLIDRLVDIVPAVTQLVYEFLKEKVENL